MVFVKKLIFLPRGFYRQTEAEKIVFFFIFCIEKNSFQTIKVKFQKRPKNRIFQSC